MPVAAEKPEVWAIVPPKETKRAALMFDRIYKWPNFKGLGFLTQSVPPARLEELFLGPISNKDWRPPDELTFGTPEDDAIFQGVWKGCESRILRALGGGPAYKYDPSVIARATETIFRNHSVGPNPLVFSSPYQHYLNDNMQLTDSSSFRFEAALNEIPIVSNDHLDWQQILEFRKDENNKRKYKDLRLWLQTGLQARTLSEAQDLIAKKVEDYKQSLRTWGINTAIGAIKQIFEIRNEMGTFAAAVCTWVISNGNVWASIAVGGASLVAKSAIFTAESFQKLREAQRAHREVALLVEIERKFSPRD